MSNLLQHARTMTVMQGNAYVKILPPLLFDLYLFILLRSGKSKDCAHFQFSCILILNPKKTEESIWPPCGFSEIIFSRERVKLLFSVTFDMITRFIFPENFNKIHLVFQKIWRFSLILAIFANFSDFLTLLVAKKLMTSPCNRSC